MINVAKEEREGMMNEAIFREYDIRGVAERDLSSLVAFSIGAAFVELLSERSGRAPSELRVVIGRDARLSGPRLISALEAGMHAQGAQTIHLGLAPTPLVYFALCELGQREEGEEPCHGGVIVTGSHNPPEWNGFKLCVGHEALYGADLQTLKRKAHLQLTRLEGLVPITALLPRAALSLPVDLTARYAERLSGWLSFGARRLKVVVDGGNGALGPCALALFARLPVDVIPLHCDPDGAFPNHHPDPTVEENLEELKALVRAECADLGVAFDGDGDRVGVVDSLGRVLWGDQLMILFAREVLSRRPGARVIGEVKCSQALYDEVERAGGVPEMWRVGHSLIKARMKETGAPLAGEMSGHIFFADRFYGHDDAAYVAARLLELLSLHEGSLSEWRDALPQSYTTPELRVDCPDELKDKVVERAREHFSRRYAVVNVDGARIQFPEGWGLIRASNTQPSLVLRFEATSASALKAQVSELERWFRDEAPEATLSGPLS